MHLSHHHIIASTTKKDTLKVVLDEPRLYVEESLGSVMVRGEVIVHFARDTQIQGPIELLFEGIQRFHPWPLIMRGETIGSPIITKLLVIELSLLPPNSKGIMPAGTQRFPFEFPIPASLPTSVYIKDRLEIFYQMSATLRRSSQNNLQHHHDTLIHPTHWIEWARRNTIFKKKYTACSPLRIVRAMESIVSNGLPITATATATATTTTTTTTRLSSPSTELTGESSEQESVAATAMSQQGELLWNQRGLDVYQGTYDEQPDQLASSFAGRTSGNLSQPAHTLGGVQGIRYKIGVDRTAIALGTSVGVELMIEPVYEDAVIKSVLLKLSESRKYAMKVPAGHTWDKNTPETKKMNEATTLVLKWADGYQVEDEEDESRVHKQIKSSSKKKGERYLRQRVENSQYLAYFDPPQPGCPEGKQFLNSTFDKKMKPVDHLQEHETSCSAANRDMLNLKELNQPIKVGEYFGGRFVVPMPDCSHILHPSMDYESIKIGHWLQLVVTIECNGESFDLLLDSPARILDCRLVADDECQTVLPPPPSYQPSHHENNWSHSTFWEQREPITFVSGWGSCVPCPCEYKKIKALEALKKPATTRLQAGHRGNNNESNSDSCPSSRLPEWGPPPCYSED